MKLSQSCYDQHMWKCVYICFFSLQTCVRQHTVCGKEFRGEEVGKEPHSRMKGEVVSSMLLKLDFQLASSLVSRSLLSGKK